MRTPGLISKLERAAKRRGLVSLYVALPLLVVSTAAAILWAVFRSDSSFVASWLPNFGTECFALALVVGVVDQILASDRKRRRSRIRAVTAGSLVTALRPLVLDALVTVTYDVGAASPPQTLRELFEQWSRFIKEHQYRTRLFGSDATSTVAELRALRTRWSELRTRLDVLDADLPLLTAVDDFVGWMDRYDSWFEYKVYKYKEGIERAWEEEEGKAEYPGYAWSPVGADPRPSLTKLIVGAGERIVSVLAAFDDAGLLEPEVQKDELTELQVLHSAQGQPLWWATREPIESS